MLLGEVVLAFSRGAVDDGNLFLLRPAARTTTEPGGHANQVSIVERVVASRQVTPPQAEVAGAAREPKIRVEDDPINAIVLADQQVSV